MDNLQSFYHILIIEDQKARRMIALEEQTYHIGRESNNDILIYDRGVSRYHATIIKVKISPRPGPNNYLYRIIDGDLSGNLSTNGLIINGKQSLSHDLKHGDVIVFSGNAKASFYILSQSPEIALFNLVDEPELSNEFINNSSNPGKATLITKEDNEKLLSAENLQRLASFPELTPHPIVEIDFQGHITYLNPTASLKFETIQQDKLSHPVLADLITQVPNTQGHLLVREIQVGKLVYDQYVHYLADSELIRSYLFEVTQRKRSEATLEYRAFHDTLTGLPNRALFKEQISLALAQAKRHQSSMAIMLVDLDHYSRINETYGQGIGDFGLEEFAKRLKICLRGGDTIARWGGDRFVLLLPQMQNADDSIKLAQRVLNALNEPFKIYSEQIEIEINGSIGIANYPQDGTEEDILLKNADSALYKAKDKGGNQYQFYSCATSAKASLLLKLETLLAQAIKENTLSLSYQPQVKVHNAAITGLEALVRWYHPELGNVPPNKLIPLIEQTDLSVSFSHWVLRKACSQNKAWQEAGLAPLPVSINLSLRQFQQTNLVKHITAILEETKLEPRWLELEINESIIMEDEAYSYRVLKQLQDLGVRICLDDFGKGYTCLKYLQTLGFNTVKIEQSFVENLQDNVTDTAIITAIVSLSKSFNYRVIAEGVERIQQVEILQRLHCDQAQGYLFSRPLKPEDVTQLLLNQPSSILESNEKRS